MVVLQVAVQPHRTLADGQKTSDYHIGCLSSTNSVFCLAWCLVCLLGLCGLTDLVYLLRVASGLALGGTI